MNAFLTQSKRSKAISALLVLLLAAAVAVGSIGISVWVSVGAQIKALTEQYTTVGILPSQNEDALAQILYDREKGTLAPLSQQGDAIPGLAGEDIRCVLGAYVPGAESVTSHEFGQYSSAADAFDTYSSVLVVVAARCENIYREDDRGELAFYMADFTVLDTLAAHPSFTTAPIETVTYSVLRAEDGELPFTVGKTYLLFGLSGILYAPDYADGKHFYSPANIGHRILSWQDTSEVDTNGYLFHWEKRIGDTNGWAPYTLESALLYPDFHYIWYALTPDSLPAYAEYTGSWEDFLNSEEGTVWRDVVLPLCEKNYAAVTVMLTDNVNAHPFFNMGIASLLEGRTISKSEYENGDKVCLVSAAWAAKNGVAVGDTIDLELYKVRTFRVQALTSPAGYQDWATAQEPLKEENKISDTEGYTVVGIYTAPEFSAGLYAFDANTVFAPKASVPNAQEYETLTDAALYSVIIENGRAEEFEAAMAERGYSGLFEYYDQGYSEVVDAILAARDNAGRLLLIGVLAVVLAGALFLFLTFRRMAPVARGMRLLGVKPAAVGREAFAAVALLAAIAAALGTALGAALYGRVTAALVSMTLELPLGANLLCGLACFLLVAALAALLSLATARQNLMQRK